MQAKPIIRTSDRGIFKGCRMRWDFSSKLRMNYEPIVAPVPLEFGTAIHAALEVYYDPQLWRTPRAAVEAAAIGRFIEVCNEQKARHLAATDQDDLVYEKDVEFQNRVTLGTGMLRNYFAWAPEHDKVIEPVLTEIEFEVPIVIPDDVLPKVKLPFDALWVKEAQRHELVIWQDNQWVPVVYQGRVDLIVRELLPPHRYWIWDHKTVGQMGSTEWLEMDDQGGSYIWALREKLGLNIAGVVYNQLLKDYPKPPVALQGGGFSKNKQQRTTYEVYRRTLEEAGEPLEPYADFLNFLRAQPDRFNRRVQIHRSTTEIANLERAICLEAMDMLGNPAIYRNAGPFNCMGCAYKAPCLAHADGQDVEFILNQYYRKRDDDRDTGTARF